MQWGNNRSYFAKKKPLKSQIKPRSTVLRGGSLIKKKWFLP